MSAKKKKNLPQKKLEVDGSGEYYFDCDIEKTVNDRYKWSMGLTKTINGVKTRTVLARSGTTVDSEEEASERVMDILRMCHDYYEHLSAKILAKLN